MRIANLFVVLTGISSSHKQSKAVSHSCGISEEVVFALQRFMTFVPIITGTLRLYSLSDMTKIYTGMAMLLLKKRNLYFSVNTTCITQFITICSLDCQTKVIYPTNQEGVSLNCKNFLICKSSVNLYL